MSTEEADPPPERPAARGPLDADVALAARLLGGRARAVAWGGRTRVVVPAGGPVRRARGVHAAQAYRARARTWRWLVAARSALAPGPALAASEPIAPHAWLPRDLDDLTPRAVLLGTPGPRRSLVIILADPAGRDRAVAKLAAGRCAEEALRRESEALHDPGVAAHAPEPLGTCEVDGRPGLLTAYVHGRPLRDPDEGLRRLAQVFEPAPGAAEADPAELPLIGDICRAAGIDPGRVAEALGRAVPVVRTHGDLAPWNVLRSGNGPILIDWEESRPDGVPGLDLAHFLLSADVLLRDVPPDAAAREAATRLAGAGWSPAAADALVALAAGDRLRRGLRDGAGEAAQAPWRAGVAATRLGSA